MRRSRFPCMSTQPSIGIALVPAILLLPPAGALRAAGPGTGPAQPWNIMDPPQAVARGPDSPPDTILPDTVRVVPLEEIRVQVLRSPLSPVTSPLAVSVLAGRDVGVGRGGWWLEEALQALPGLQVQNRFNAAVGERITVRGAGARAQFGIRGLRILVDGIPATLPDGQASLDHVSPALLERVELLRGPASALYGNGAGGVLRLESVRPPAEGGMTQGSVAGGSFGSRRFHVLSGGRVGPAGFLFAPFFESWLGFRSDPTGDGRTYGASRRWGLHSTVIWPTPGGKLSGVLNLVGLKAENPGSLPRSLLAENSHPASALHVRQRAGKEVHQLQAGLSREGALGGLESHWSIYGIRREVHNPLPPAIVDLSRTAGGARWELVGRRKGRGTEWEWRVGAEGEGQWDLRHNRANSGGTPGSLTLHQRETVLGGGMFVQGTALLKGMRFLAGIRGDAVRFQVSDRLVKAGDPDDSGRRVMKAVTPATGLWIPLTGALSFRVGATTLFQTPTTSELANRPSGAGGFNPSLRPLRGVSLEGGFQGRVRPWAHIEITGFAHRLQDELVPFEVPGTEGRTYYRNAGASLYRGLEVAAVAAVGSAVRLRTAYTHTDARFRRYASQGRNLAGKQIPGVPPRRGEAVLSWSGSVPRALSPSRGHGGGADDGDLPEGARAFLELRALYRSGMFVDDANTQRSSAHALLDLRGGLEDWEVFGLVLAPFGGISNLLNRRYTASVVVNAAGGRYFEPGPGRAAYVGLTMATGTRGREQ